MKTFIMWLCSFLNEPGTKEGSSQRLMLVTIIVVMMGLIAWLTIAAGKFPEVPRTLFEFVEYVVTTLVVGVGIGKGVSAYKARKGEGDVPNTAAGS